MYSNIFSSEIRQQNRTEQNRTEQNPYRASFGRRTEQNRTEQNRTEQNRTEQNRTEQNRTEQNRTEQNRTELLQNLFYCKRKSCKVYFSRLIGLLLVIRNKILSLIILNFLCHFLNF
ncbi:hypothetical protein EPJ65_07280 [Brachyspira aalborgi]|nr:hypothetical protein EPJ65_07280 [Brachyspira aalborgi]